MRPKFKGARLEGGYWIPYRHAADYRRRVKTCRKAAVEAMGSFCAYAFPQFQGSEDGEAVTGLNAKGELVAIIHLDSDGMELIEQGIRQGNLAQLLNDYNNKS